MNALEEVEGIVSSHLVATLSLKEVFKKQQPQKSCGKTYCSFYDDTNHALRKFYCDTPEAKKCFFARKEGQTGMFSDPRGGQYFLSSA